MSRPAAAVRNGYCKHGFPSPLCVSCLAQPPCVHNLPTGSCFQCLMLSTAVVPASATVAELPAKLDKEIRMLAALCYGEGSTNNVFEEMAALANVYVRQAKARKKKSVSDLVLSEPTYSYVVGDGNKRYKKFKEASDEQVKNDAGMSTAVRAALNAVDPAGRDYSNGAYFWDGADIKTNYAGHPKVKKGIKFSDPTHNIYGIKETTKLVIEYWKVKDKTTGREVNGKERGRYDHVYISTAAYGGTIFWKLNPDYVRATGGVEYK